jgi:hypothetical protein
MQQFYNSTGEAEGRVMELNPEHPVTKSMHDQWHKIVALVMQKLGSVEVVITSDDILKLGAKMAVVAQEKADGLHISLMTIEEGERLAKREMMEK